MQINLTNAQYAGFWSRILAMLLDSVVQLLVLAPLVLWIYGPALLTDTSVMGTPLGFALNYGLPLLYCVIFWRFRSATPGKLLMDMVIVDADTGGAVPSRRLVLRYLGYYVCIFTLLLGFIWIAFDKRKQGLHDKMARTVVVIKPAQSKPMAHPEL